MNPPVHDDRSRPTGAGLPVPTEAELAHQDRLVRHVRAALSDAGGVLPFDRFMELVLYAPGLGYYSAGRHKFGSAGDFVTAPEFGSVFAQCLARSCRPVLAELGGGDVLEVGAGRGSLAADLLLAWEASGPLPQHYYILELSADLRALQTETLRNRAPHLAERVRWLEDVPRNFRGLVLANELLDAMPVTRFRIAADGVQELCVGWDNGAFVWRARLAPEPVCARVEALGLPIGYTSELNLRAEAWVRRVAEELTQGVLLLIDYGFPRAEFYHPQRTQGTLMCHYRHRAHDDPLRCVGLQDISAHVDFSAIAAAGTGAGLALLGYTSQAAFLIESGIEELVHASNPQQARAHLALTRQIKKLTLPHEMGELFKVIAFGRGVTQAPLGFRRHDRRARL